MKFDRFLDKILPISTRRRSLYNRVTSAIEMVVDEGIGTLWTQAKHKLRQSLFYIFPKKVSEITEIEDIIDDRRRLMVVVPSLTIGGSERCAAILLEHLNRTLINPELITIFNRKSFYPLTTDIKVHILENQPPLGTPTNRLTLPHRLHKYTNDIAWLEKIALKLAKLIRKRQSSVILAQDYYASTIALLAKRHIPVATRLIVSSHCVLSEMLSATRGGELHTFLIKKLFNDADSVIAVSQGVAEDLVRNFEVMPEKIVIVHNPINLKRLQELSNEPITEHDWFAEDIPIALFVGRLTQLKGLDYLLRAVSLVRRTTKLRCVLIGEGKERVSLTHLACQLGITADVLFLGRQQNPYKFMRKATLFVLPSLSEGFPYVLSEALSCGCLVIATDCPRGGSKEILREGEYGLLVPPRDEKALSAAILRLLTDKELREKFSKLGVRRVGDFDLESSLKAYEDIILENK